MQSETSLLILVTLVTLGIIYWGYRRALPYGKLGILAWLQSIVLMTPWLLFFGLFALGIYLNLIGVILLVVLSTGVYIYLGKRLRSEGQEELLRERAAQRLKQEQESGITDNNDSLSSAIVSEILPISTEDLQQIKGIFGIDTFFATETISYQEGAIFKGNLRGEPETVHNRLSEMLKERLGDKYRLFLVESPEERPVIIVLPSSNDPKTTTLAQKNLALALLVGTIATILEATGLLQGFDWFSEMGRYQEILPLSIGLALILAVHEISHWVIAKKHQIRLSVPFFIPSWQIGSFGAITRFESLLPNRSTLFDISLAGPAASGLISLIILIIGLILSHPGSAFQIPAQFFQGSILVGTLAKVVLGSALQGQIVDTNPLVILGWLGLVITALNLLPAGQLDGGRIVQAIYGRKTARIATIASLVVLGIVAIVNPANPIPLYWAIIILFLQRGLERPSLNELTEPDDTRAALGLLALFLMLATLIPLSPSLAGQLGIG